MKILYTTIDTSENAKSLVTELLTQKTIACANIIPMHSMYLDNNTIIDTHEYIIICKTTKIQTAKKLLKKLHPYTTPCILELQTTANTEFVKWIKSQLT